MRLVNACQPDFRNLVRGALLTGCRYSELTATHAADFNADAGVVTVRTSKAGKASRAMSCSPMKASGCSSRKLGKEPNGLWVKSHQLWPMVEASKQANIKPGVSFHVLRHTHGSTLAMRGVPFGVIAE